LERPVLDVGCGDGLFMSNVFRDPLDVGLDISGREASRARKRGAYREVVTSSVFDIPFPENTFKTVTSNCVFEHLKEPVEAFAEIHRVLQPGGRYVFTAHSDRYDDYLYYPGLLRRMGLSRLARGYSDFLRARFKHFSCLSPERWSAMLESVGFTQITYEYYLPRRSLETFDLLLPLSTSAYVNKKLFGRWVLLPRGWLWKVFGGFLRARYAIECDCGGALLMVAYKKTSC
ncbi:class I SAM-dependent methyltransferase, partial [bacterium]|nr:class I SAM-dependent methyltransferase [candidate division CSSED10-310 bacterium]